MPLEAFGVNADEQVGPTHAVMLGSQSMVGDGGGVRPPNRAPPGRDELVDLALGRLLRADPLVDPVDGVGRHGGGDHQGPGPRSGDGARHAQPTAVGADDPRADLTFDVRLATGSLSGDALVGLVTKAVPVGCMIWFENLTGTIPIRVPPTKVNNAASFSVATLVTLPAAYTATLRGFLQLAGQTLADAWSIQSNAVHVNTDQAAELRRQAKDAIIDGSGPTPGTLLGAVTVTG